MTLKLPLLRALELCNNSRARKSLQWWRVCQALPDVIYWTVMS